MNARSVAAGLVGMSVVLGASTGARAENTVAQTDKVGLEVGGMIQALGLAEHVDDRFKNDDRLYLFMNRARLRLNGHYERVFFKLEMALGGEETIVSTTGVSLSLLDFSFAIPLSPNGTTYLQVGQFKVPYGREQLAYSANFQFADRSIDNLGFRVGRDVGIAVVSRPKAFTLIGGVFTGGGRDVPPNHYLPEKLGVPLVVARAGIGNVDDDPFALAQDDVGTTTRKLKAAFFVNGLYTRDSTIGHSTVLNVKLADKSLLLDSDWNPYIGKAPLDAGSWWQVGADAAVRAPVRAVDLAGEAQVDFGKYSNSYGSVQMWGLRLQGGAVYRSFEVALRYALLAPDSNFAYMTVPLTGSQLIQEVTPSLAWFIKGRMLKLLADLPILIHDPVFTEAGVGSYVATDLPDQATVLAAMGVPTASTVTRQNVLEARLMLQAQF